MTRDTIHLAKEFSEFPYSTLVDQPWSSGRGGYGLSDESYSISIIREDGSADIWELPECLSTIIQDARSAAVEQKLREIRSVLKI